MKVRARLGQILRDLRRRYRRTIHCEYLLTDAASVLLGVRWLATASEMYVPSPNFSRSSGAANRCREQVAWGGRAKVSKGGWQATALQETRACRRAIAQCLVAADFRPASCCSCCRVCSSPPESRQDQSKDGPAECRPVQNRKPSRGSRCNCVHCDVGYPATFVAS